MLKKVILFIISVALFITGNLLLRQDFSSFFQWWVVVLILGLSFMPITVILFSSFSDKGYLFSKVIGIALVGYLMWLFSSLHLLKFTVVSCILCAGIGLLINVLVLFFFLMHRRKTGNPVVLLSILRSKIFDRILTQEVVFFAIFLLFTYIRGFKPEAYGTEKFMDYGFMTSMLRSEYMPPQDFWFSGSLLNYYYVGQYLAAFLTRLSFVKAEVGYNIMLMMVGAFAVVLPYSLVNNVMHRFFAERGIKAKVLPAISGAVAGIGVCIAGNMHYPTFKWLEPLVRKFFGMEANTERYWFPDATRFIGYHPETNDKTIHEFPSYSFVLGDLHAHVINIMFVLTVLGLLFTWQCKRRSEMDRKLPLWKEIFSPQILAISFFIGLFHTTNYWDFPIYFVVSGAVILFTNLIVYNFKGKAVGITALQGVAVIVISEIVCLPFTIKFDRISSNPVLASNHTPLNQLIILWGLPIFVVVSFLCFMVADYRRRRKAEEGEGTGSKKAGLFHFMEGLTSSDLFVITLGLCAIGLVLMPEVIYIEDIYSGDYKRANTMFKLTYQAFIMFGICFGYILLRLMRFGETRRQKRYAIVGLLLFSLTVCYVQNAVNSWYGRIYVMSSYRGLDCTAFLETTSSLLYDAEAIDWLNENVKGMPVVLEANGDSYTDYQRVSVFTGLPTVLGWRTHEWLWKSDTEKLDERAADIETIYTAEDKEEVLALLEEYKIAYIYVGKLEQDKYADLNHELLKSLGKVVYENPDYAHAKTYIIQITN